MRIKIRYNFSDTQCRLGRDIIEINEPVFIYEVDCEDLLVKNLSEYELKKKFENEALEAATLKYLNDFNSFVYKDS